MWADGRSARVPPTRCGGGGRAKGGPPGWAWARRWGPAYAVRRWVESQGGTSPVEVAPIVEATSKGGGTPLVVADGPRVLGVIHLKDVVKPGIAEKFVEMRKMGIRTVMITGDNPLTAAAIAAEAGVDDFLAEATPEDKMALIKKEQAG